ncbi:hypothetical protein NFHSH190041_00570 [Shewanella sp. NFH-SH190041]|uniref:hypothetical protein n=1 Tax=Shewanella sp. NFH-SH190041 TaxID=2950245 RepID=UPI0021C36EEA|nr:hypothetical protein [Shewanella sp. NFH-SH190041]BDM62605.1 hypothetical protein NFHSH190041_00570 [Shewanella sp. NFH-SH190041]
MSKPVKFSVFCERYQLDATEQDTHRLYNVYVDRLDVFNKVLSDLIVAEAIAKARDATAGVRR